MVSALDCCLPLTSTSARERSDTTSDAGVLERSFATIAVEENWKNGSGSKVSGQESREIRRGKIRQVILGI